MILTKLTVRYVPIYRDLGEDQARANTALPAGIRPGLYAELKRVHRVRARLGELIVFEA